MDKDLRLYEGATAALIFFGNVGLMIPYKGAENGEFTFMATAFLISCALYFLCFKGLQIYKTGRMNKALFCGVGIVLIAFCLYVCFETSRHFIEFLSTEVLIKNRKILSVLAFSGVCLYAFFKSPVAITKFSAPAIVFILLSVAVLFFISLDNFSVKYIPAAFMPRSAGAWSRSFKYLYIFFFSPIIYPVFSAFYFKKPSLKTEFAGITLGMVLLCVCFLSAVLTFSLPEAAEIKNAYSKSISVISVGELFTRMEGIGYFIFFFSALVKTVVSAFAVKAILFSMNIKRSRETAALLIFGTILISGIV